MRVVLADDSGLFRDLLARTLADGGHQVVGVAGGADEVLGLVNATGPDVVVMDIRMPPTCTDDGLQAALRLRARHPQVGVVLLSQHGEVDYAMRLVAGVPDRVGYLLKERATGARELLDALERVAAGGAVIDPDLVARMLTRPRVANPLDKLTERERETLALMAEGFGNAAIARQMRVTVSTVEKHASALFRKLGLATDASTVDNARVRAVLSYLRHTGRLPPHRDRW